MTFWAILSLLVLVSALVAYVGDRVAKWAGKKHWRVFGLRPRATATLVAVTTGVLISLGAYAAFILSVQQARETILEGELIRQERNQLRQEKSHFTREIERLKDQTSILKGQVARVFAEHDQLARERDQLAEGQKNTLEQLRQTEIQLQVTKNQEADLAQEAANLKAANQGKQAALLQAELQAKAAKAKLAVATQQLQWASGQARLVRQQAQNDQLQLRQAQQSLKVAREDLKLAQSSLKSARLEVTDLQETRRTLIRERVELDASRAKLERQAQEIGQRLQSLEIARKATQKQVAELEARARALEAEKRELEGDVTALLVAKNTPRPIAEVPANAKATPKIEAVAKVEPTNPKAAKSAPLLVVPPEATPPKTELLPISPKTEVPKMDPPKPVVKQLEPSRTRPLASIKPKGETTLPSPKTEGLPVSPKTEITAPPIAGAIPVDPEQEANLLPPVVQAVPKGEVSVSKTVLEEPPPIPALSVTSKAALPGAKPEVLRQPIQVSVSDQGEIIKTLKTNEAALRASEASLKASEASLKLSEAALKAETTELKSQLLQTRRENEQLKENRRLLLVGLQKVLRPVLLAEQLVEPGLEGGALSEIARRSDLKTRLWGFKGTEVVQAPVDVERPGLLLARPIGVSPEGKVLVQIEFHPREQAFTSGEILLIGGLILPSSPSEIRRRIAIWERDAQDKLAQAGWIPEKLLQGGINLEEIVTLTNQIAGKRGGAKVGIIALDDLFTTEPPKLGLKVMP